MVDLEPILETPFEQASNRSFELVLGVGVVLLAVVATFGRSPVTRLAVSMYLLAIPVFVVVRIWVWESPVIPDPEDSTDGGDHDDEGANGGEGDEREGDDVNHGLEDGSENHGEDEDGSATADSADVE